MFKILNPEYKRLRLIIASVRVNTELLRLYWDLAQFIVEKQTESNYRAAGILEGDELTWFWIGSHKEYDVVIKRLRNA